MILTVCLSPCTDITIELDALNMGKVNVVKNKTLNYSGRALNVAIGVSRLGGEAYMTGFMYNENGVMFEQALDNEHVPFMFVWNKGRVRENFKFIDRHSMLTEVNDIGEPVAPEKLDELLEMVKTLSARSTVTVISGGLPRGVHAEYYERLFNCLDARSKRIIDTDGDRLFAGLRAGVDLAKPNLDELQDTLGRELPTRADQLHACYELIDRGAKNVLLSLGADGALITNGTHNYFCQGTNVAVSSAVGAGDCMVSAAALVMEKGGDLPEILRSGVAAGTAKVSSTDSSSLRKDKFEEIYSRLTVEEF